MLLFTREDCSAQPYSINFDLDPIKWHVHQTDHDGDARRDEGDGRAADLAHEDEQQDVPVAVVGHVERPVVELPEK